MQKLKPFILHLAIVFSNAALAAAVLLYTIKPDPNHYYQGSVLKTRLLAETPSPRIVVVGGSNIAWGIDSGLIEHEMGMPVINDGLDVHIGIIPLVELKEYINEGDIIIVSLEYYNFASLDDFFGISQYQADWIEFSPERIKYIESPYKNSLPVISMVLQRKINREINRYLYNDNLSEFRGIYSSKYFNQHGDFIGHINDDTPPRMNADYGGFPVNQLGEGFSFLNKFNQYALLHGAKVFYEAPASRQTNCDLTGGKNIRRFYNALQSQTGIPLLTNLDHICYPDEYFYDTPYHLNKLGRRIRTEQLIINLKAALAGRK
jgi:hypothetical protein